MTDSTARRAAFGFAECGRRRLRRRPLSRCPLCGQRGAARFSVIYRLRRLAFPRICTGSVSRRFATHSCTSGIEKAAATAEEGTRRLARQAPSRGGRFVKTAHGGFLHALPSLTPRNAAAHTSSTVGTPARRAAFGFAECGRRRLRRRPLSRCPLCGQRGAAPLYRKIVKRYCKYNSKRSII